MTPDLVHSVWKLLDSPESLELLDAAPEQVVAHVLESLNSELHLSPETALKVREYLLARIPLISDFLWDSLAQHPPCTV